MLWLWEWSSLQVHLSHTLLHAWILAALLISPRHNSGSRQCRPGSPFNVPVVSKDTKVATPSWVKLPKGVKGLWSVIEANCIQPPASAYSNPLKLTAAQIKLYGFPPKQDYQDEMTEWVSLVQHSQHRSCLGTVTNQVNNAANAASARASVLSHNGHKNPIGFRLRA